MVGRELARGGGEKLLAVVVRTLAVEAGGEREERGSRGGRGEAVDGSADAKPNNDGLVRFK